MDHFPKQLLELLLIQMLIQGVHVNPKDALALMLLHTCGKLTQPSSPCLLDLVHCYVR